MTEDGATPHAAAVRGVYSSAVVAVAIQWSIRLIGLISVLILARLLTPADFGVVSLALVATAFVELIGAVGFRQALLRIKDPGREHLDTAWTIQLILYSAMGLLTLATAPAVASFYREPALTAVLIALSLRYFCLAFVNIGIVEFERRLDFGRDLRMRVGARLSSFVLTVTAAMILQNYWALVIGLVSYSALLTVASFLAHPYRPRLSLQRRADLLGISIWIFVAALGQSVQMQIERLVLGRTGTPAMVGLFSVSKDLSIIFTHEIATALNRVTFSTVSRDRQPLGEQAHRIGSILGAYAMIAAPLGFGLAATADDAVAMLLGHQWAEAAPYLRMVAVYSAFFAVYKSIASILQAAGQARLVALMSIVGAAVLAVAVSGAASLWPGGLTVAAAALVANLALLLGGIWVISRAAGTKTVEFLGHVFRPFIAAATMGVVVTVWSPATEAPFIDLAVAVMIGAASYPVALLGAWAALGCPTGAESKALRSVVMLYRRAGAARLSRRM